jgi:hypothetical protein
MNVISVLLSGATLVALLHGPLLATLILCLAVAAACMAVYP